MTAKEAKTLSCPFCGAPYREIVPPDTLQLECRYCGGVFLVPSIISGEVPRCATHSDRWAIGLCNDCGKSYCGECLRAYVLETRSASAILHLCPDCLGGRHAKDVRTFIYFGLIMLLVATIFGVGENLFAVVLFSVLGFGAIIFAVSKGSGTPEEPTIDEVRAREKESLVDAEELYKELLSSYVTRWGVTTGTQLLDGEISAYLRSGASFPEAVKKVSLRQLRESFHE